MGLKTTLDKDQFGELDEAQQALYVELEGGGYALDVEDIDSHPTVKSLKSGHSRSKQERDEAKRRLATLKEKFGDLIDAEDLDLSGVEAEKLEAVLPYLRGEGDLPADDGGDGGDKGGKGKNQPDLEKIKANARKPVERERDEALQRAEKAEATLNSVVSDAALTSAVAEVKIAGPYVKAVKAMFKDRVKITEGEDGTPVAMIEGEYGEQPVDKYLKEWAGTDEGKAFVAAPDNGGGGARTTGNGGGKIKNPFKKKTEDGKPNPNFSITEQGRLQREQPEVARRMAKEAGWSDDKIRW